MYVVFSDWSNDFECDNNILAITTDYSLAKKIFDKEVKDIKCDVDFDNLDIGEKESTWALEESATNFQVYEKYNYVRNHNSVSLTKRELYNEKENDYGTVL